METFNFHNYDSLVNNSSKIDPRRVTRERKVGQQQKIPNVLNPYCLYMLLGDQFPHCPSPHVTHILVHCIQELATTQIMYASHAGALSSLQRYLMAGMDFNLRDYDGRSALHLAAAEGHLNVVEFLLSKAAVDPNPTDR